MSKHRIISPLNKEFAKGKNLLFLYGMNKDEIYYYDYVNGVIDLSQTLKLASLEKENFLVAGEKNFLNSELYVEINNEREGMTVFKKTGKEIEDITKEYLFPKSENDTKSDAFAGSEVEKEGGDREKTDKEKEVTANFTALGVRLKLLKKKLEEEMKSCLIFFNKFEWVGKLYSTDQDSERTRLEIIEFLKNISNLDGVKIVVNIVDIDLIKDFHFDLEENSIYIGNPSGKEILKTYFKKYMSKTELNDLNLKDLIKELKDISYAMSSSNKTMKEAIRVYENIVKDNKKYCMKKENFEIAVEKINDENIKLSDVVLNEETKKNLEIAINNFLNPTDEKHARKGIILTGPPGTGKTFLVKALANEKNCYFLAPSLADLKGEYVGQTSAKVKRVFDKARANEPTIIFIDEADTIFTDRNLETDSYSLDMVNQFLVEIDGLKTGKQKIFVIAATNRPEKLDSAVQSRLSEKIKIPLPNREERKELFDKKLKKYNFNFKEKSFQDDICEKTEGMSGRDIDNFVKKLLERVGKYDLIDLDDDENTKKLFFEILKDKEEEMIQDLIRRIPLEIKKPEEIKTKLTDIIGYDKLKTDILDMISYLTEEYSRKKERERLGIKNQYGILLYGPPGNAKTKLTEGIAKDKNLYYIKVLSKDFVNRGGTSILDNITLLFDEIKKLAKITDTKNGVLLFFDEFDSLAGKSLSNEVRGTLLDYLANEEKNGLRNENTRIILMAATNYYSQIDEAVKRKGRIDKHLEITNPTETEGIEIIKYENLKDEEVENLDEDMIKKIYNSISKNKKEKISFYELIDRIGEMGKLIINEKDKEEFFQQDVVKVLLRPSGSDLVDAYTELKRKCYNKAHKLEGKLKITKEIITEVFGNLENEK